MTTDWQHQWHEWDEHNCCLLCGVDGNGFGDTFEIPPCSDNARRAYAAHKREVSGISDESDAACPYPGMCSKKIEEGLLCGLREGHEGDCCP